MRVRRFAPVFAPGLVLVSALAASASAAAIRVDPARSNIEFILTDVLHTVRGSFRIKSGVLDFDAAQKTLSGSIVVDAASGESGNKTRDGRMKRTYLETDRYPDITFSPTGFSGSPGADGAPVTVTGTFVLHGQSHVLSIPMQVKISGNQVSAGGSFTIPYVAWGIKNPSTLFLRVSDKVEIHISATGYIQ